MRKSADPFEVDPLPKTFYYPSQQKVLPDKQRKICLSPSHGREETSKSPSDDKFLRQADHMKIHEIPTRENGSTDLDQSSSSKFEESWPSTERAMVSTPEVDAESFSLSKTTSSEGTDIPFKPLPDSTLARYIHRFRNAPPSSRQARDHGYFDSGKANEFWWLSPSPPSSSTPKVSTPPEQLRGPSPHSSSSPKLKRNAARRAASPASPISKTRKGLSPFKSSTEGLDEKTADLQQRARRLLEKSESTLESSSSEVQRPKRVMQHKRPKDGSPTEASFVLESSGHLPEMQQRRWPRPAPPQEEDILYQWRLARKMEKAYEQVAKRSPIWGPHPSTQLYTSSSASSASPISQTPHLVPQMDKLHQTTASCGPTPSALARSSSLTTETQPTFSSFRIIPSPFETTSLPPTSNTPFQGVVESVGDTVLPGTGQPIVRPVGPQVSHKPLVIEKAEFESAKVPSHMHLSCDILPCPHQRALIESEVSDKVPLSIPVIDKMERKSHIDRHEMEMNAKPKRSAVTSELLDERGDHLERIMAQNDVDSKGPLSVPVVDSMLEHPEERQLEMSIMLKQNGSVSEESSDKRPSRHTRQNKSNKTCHDKGLHSLREESVSLPTTEKSKVKERKGWKPKSNRSVWKETDRGDLLKGVIGEVVSERLYSTPCSSTSSLTDSEGSIVTKEPEARDYDSVLEQENTAPGAISDNEFPDDEVLVMLRQRASRYREQLRQIDSLLSQQQVS